MSHLTTIPVSRHVVYHTHVDGLQFFVSADGPGHAAVQLLALLRDMRDPRVRRQVQVGPTTYALGQSARDAVRDEDIPVGRFKLEEDKR